MTSRSDRCPTTAGPFFRCDRPAGHAGECESREAARPWVGPARTGLELAAATDQLRAALARALHGSLPREGGR